MEHRSRFGTLLFLGGAAGLLSVFLAGPLGWRAADRLFGYATPLWSGLFLTVMLGGAWRLWFSDHGTTPWAPTRPGRRFTIGVLYSRPDCPLCDEARELLEHYRPYLPTLTEVNVDLDPVLEERFGNWVPVLELDGRVRFKGVISPVLLRRMIEGTPPNPDAL